MDSKYSISEPQEVLSSDYLGTFLIRQNANQYACKKKRIQKNGGRLE